MRCRRHHLKDHAFRTLKRPTHRDRPALLPAREIKKTSLWMTQERRPMTFTEITRAQ